MDLNEEQLKEIICEDNDVWAAVTDEEIYDTGRWHTHYARVFTNGDTFIEISWIRGATEYQDEGIENPEWYEVFPKTVTKTIYVTKDKLNND